MNKIDVKEILRNAIDASTYSKAYELFLTKKVILQCRRNDLGEDVYEGIVTGKSGNSYPVMAIINKDGKVVRATCKCDYYLSYEGYCKHILAFLLQINEVTNKKETNDITALLSFYKKSISLDVEVVPIFHVYNKDVGLELKIGKEKKYFIKNLNEFFDNIRKGLSFKYGKDLEFVHTLSAFDKKSQIMIEDLLDYYDYYDNDSKSYFDGKRKCKLPKIIFKKQLDQFQNQNLEFVLDDAHYDLFYTTDKVDIKLLFNNDTLSIQNKNSMRLFSIGQSYYIISKNKLYCLDNLTNQNIIPLIKLLFSKDIIFTSKIYNEFFTYIYPKISEDIEIINKEQFEMNNNCSKLETVCYLDIKDNNLHLNYQFYYDSLPKDEALKKGLYPNSAEEENFLEQLLIFGFVRAPKENEYINDDLDGGIDFLRNDIDKLKEYATIYVSDTIKNLNFKKTSPSSIGVRFQNDWCEVFFNESSYTVEELRKILKSIEEKKKYYLLKDGTVLSINDKGFTDIKGVVDSLDIKYSEVNSSIRVPLFKLVQLENVIDNNLLPVEAETFLHDLKNYKFVKHEISDKVSSYLREYQKEAFRWLYNLAHYKLGGILADDMGLGKSLEIISLLSSYDSAYPSLIVCPASLTYNWYNEFIKWNKDIEISVISGNALSREEMIKDIKMGQVVITSYDYLKRDLELYKEKKFHFMIIDEAQNIKNYNTKNAEAVKEVQAISKFALTGTPIENTLADLWSIFDYCLPGYLKSYDSFKNDYELDIIKNNDKEKLNRLTKQISPFVLRRTKKDVLKELPEKFEQVIYAQMSEEQTKVYNAMALKAKEKILNNYENKIYIFSMLTRLRQLCCHPSLFIENYTGESAKTNLTLQLVEDIVSGGHKTLIFSQFTSMLGILNTELQKMGVSTLILTGDTPTQDRYALVDKFNNDSKIKVFLISLKAGGVGLNLTGADTVIHYDPWWNLSAEKQASDRVHRIGQKRTVQIIKVIAKGSIEEKILDLQNRKQDLFDKVISDDSSILNKLSKEELLSLFD